MNELKSAREQLDVIIDEINLSKDDKKTEALLFKKNRLKNFILSKKQQLESKGVDCSEIETYSLVDHAAKQPIFTIGELEHRQLMNEQRKKYGQIINNLNNKIEALNKKNKHLNTRIESLKKGIYEHNRTL